MKKFLMISALLMIFAPLTALAEEQALSTPDPTFGSAADPMTLVLRSGTILLMPEADGGLRAGVTVAHRIDDLAYAGLDFDLLASFGNKHAGNIYIGEGSPPSRWDPALGFAVRPCLGVWVHRLIALEMGMTAAVFNLGSEYSKPANYLLGDVSMSAWGGHANLGIGVMLGAGGIAGEKMELAGGLRLFIGYAF